MADEAKDQVAEQLQEETEPSTTSAPPPSPADGSTAETVEAPIEAEEAVTAETEAAVEAVPDVAELENALATAREEAAKNLDGWQRAAADLANYKRRQEEQAARQREDITAGIISQLLPILDDYDLAFQNLPAELNDQEQKWIEGFRLIQRKINKVVEDQGVEVIDSSGVFDPKLHEAVTHEESDEHEEGHIIAELRKGYKLGNRVLRPTLVRVAK